MAKGTENKPGTSRFGNAVTIVCLSILAIITLIPIFLVFINSFKASFQISSTPFEFANQSNFVGWDNYINGITQSNFLYSVGLSVFITVFSVLLIVVCTAMCAWFMVRINNKLMKVIYVAMMLSMIVPFQMIMFPMTYTVNTLGLNNPIGMLFVYLGFGAGLSVFIFYGFMQSIPLEIEEAATIDGCNPLQTFFKVVFPMLKPTAVTIAVLNTMWIWNDYLLPYLTLGSDNATLPVAIQLAMQGSYGSTDYGGFMAMLVLAIIPIIIFFVIAQKHIIKGVVSGAVKG